MVQIWREGGGGQIRKWNVIQFPICPINVYAQDSQAMKYSDIDIQLPAYPRHPLRGPPHHDHGHPLRLQLASCSSSLRWRRN